MSVLNTSSTPRVLLAAFVLALGALFAPATVHAAGPPASGFFYVVQYGDTLESIAARFGVPVQAIAAANGLGAYTPYVGRSLYMPSGYASSYGNYLPAASSSYSVHEVEPGETMFSIAQRYGIPLYTLMQMNHLYNPNFIYTKMRLLVPRAGYAVPRAPYGTYLVRFGDTLSSIALRYGTSVYALMIANSIPNPNLIFAGMRLMLPGSSAYGTAPSPYNYPPSSGYSTVPAPMATPTAPPTGGATAAVTLRNIAYNPNSITIHVGTKVTWTNGESSAIPHTVTSGTPGAPSGTFDSGTLNPANSFQFTFNTTGTFAYFCRIHGAAMTGTVNVIP
jgi:LysM repeat protein